MPIFSDAVAPIAPPVSSPLTDENITSLNPSVLSVSPPEVLPSSSESSPPSHPRLMIEIDSSMLMGRGCLLLVLTC